ncbi:MAG: M56 family metallopeptidase [Oscillospiraceae bacterium]|nr:M56 family metallopeptidase [Oscillospiraceae bacterium]
MDIVRIVTYIYLMGVAFFIIRLFIGIIRAETLCRLGGRRLADGSRLVVCDGDFQPTSWLNTIILSRKDFESDSAAMIIEHEQAHIRNCHSIDVLLAQLVCALQWFNPAAWALKRSLQEVHEYEADAAVLADGENERQYQICLVQAALGSRIGYVTSNFADCSTKKRIKMMKRSQSSPFVCLRALLMLPVVLVTILLASACKPKTSQDNTAAGMSESITENTAQPVSRLEPVDTTFLKKFGYGSNEDFKLKQLNIFVEIEWDGAIWMTFDGEQTFHPATLDNFATEFERLKSESTVEVARPDLVFVTKANDEHLDIVQNIIKQLQNSYADDKIVLITLPHMKTVPPPPLGYAVDYDNDKCVEVEINRRNGIVVTAYNVTRLLNSAQDINPTLESLSAEKGTDSVAVEIKADNTILIKVPKLSYTVDSPDKLKDLLLRLYPEDNEKVFYKIDFRFATSRRVWNEVEEIFSDSPDKYKPFTAKPFVRVLPAMPTRQDSIKQILLGEWGSGLGDRSRHVKNMKWYNDNKDKEEFFRMGFRNGQIYVGKGDDISNMRPIEFDQLVPYFRENCPGGDERKAIVLFEINQDGTVSVAYMDKVLEKMENWITTLTRRIWVSDVPVGRPNVIQILEP